MCETVGSISSRPAQSIPPDALRHSDLKTDLTASIVTRSGQKNRFSRKEHEEKLLAPGSQRLTVIFSIHAWKMARLAGDEDWQ